MSYLIDSDILVGAAIGWQDAHDLINDATQYGAAISIISLGEVYEGAVDGLQSEDGTKLDYLRTFLLAFPILGLEDAIMETFARLRAELRSQGQLIPALDILIAASALEHDLTLVTRNVRHFSRIHDLTLRSQ